MGRESTPKKLTDSLRSQIPGQEQSVAREVRRLYLTEYARRWQDFLDSIHSINSAGEEGSSGLAYDLQVLRTLASPDSPLMRLGKAVVEQTTLVPPPDPQARQKQLAQRASGNAGKVVQTAKLFQDIHPEERLEKTLVDDRFVALREVISGRTDGGQSGGGTMQIASLLTMLNEYYTQLTIADSALAAGTLPARITAADKLQLEAAKLPAPLKNILLDLTKQGTRKINAGTGDVLNPQMEAMMGDDCRDAIDGRYPFADSPQEVSAEDFNRIFASGGVLDAFWSKQLAPLVDTASDPWRYKPTEGNMTLQGPDLTPFQQAKQIRSVFFNSEGGKKFSWSMQISVVDMDPAITELVIDIDGQVLRYAHGPDRPLKVTWPGPRNGSMAEITASPRIRQDTSTLLTGGPWALFHLLDAGKVQETAVRGRQLVEYDFDGRRVVLEITAGRDFNPVKGFGMIQIPRIGQEVLVDFKNGDPDLPIIVGRTYNQDTMPPWGLPGAATQSGIYSHTIGGGPTNANALRFEDKPGSEEVWLHAEKDQRIEVNNNESHWVGNNRVKVIDQSEIATIGAVRDHKVQYDDTSLAGGNKTIQTVKELYLAAGDSITLSCGDTVLYMSSKGEFYVTCKTFNITATDADGQINTIKGQLDLNMNKREPKVGTFGESEKTAMAAVIKETFPPKE